MNTKAAPTPPLAELTRPNLKSRTSHLMKKKSVRAPSLTINFVKRALRLIDDLFHDTLQDALLEKNPKTSPIFSTPFRRDLSTICFPTRCWIPSQNTAFGTSSNCSPLGRTETWASCSTTRSELHPAAVPDWPAPSVACPCLSFVKNTCNSLSNDPSATSS